MTVTRLTATDLAHRNHRRAVRFFWTWLILSTCVSLVGNVVHAWVLAEPRTQWLAVGVAVVPPTVLLLSVHGLAVLAKVSTSGNAYRVVLAAIAALALGAFLLSFVALRDLAVIAGIRPELAPVLPLVVDLAIGIATLALVAVGDKPARRSRSSSRGATPAATTRATINSAPATAAPASDAARSRETLTAPRAGIATSIRELAETLVAEKATRQPVELVERILAAHDAGDPLNRIAKDVRAHHTSVSRVIDAAAARGQGVLEAV